MVWVNSYFPVLIDNLIITLQCHSSLIVQTLAVNEQEYQHILRILNTNVEGGKPAPIALTKIRGIGRRFATLICRKAEIDIRKRYDHPLASSINDTISVMSIMNPFLRKIVNIKAVSKCVWWMDVPFDVQSRRDDPIGDWKGEGDYPKSPTVQHSRLVPQPTKGYADWKTTAPSCLSIEIESTFPILAYSHHGMIRISFTLFPHFLWWLIP